MKTQFWAVKYLLHFYEYKTHQSFLKTHTAAAAMMMNYRSVKASDDLQEHLLFYLQCVCVVISSVSYRKCVGLQQVRCQTLNSITETQTDSHKISNTDIWLQAFTHLCISSLRCDYHLTPVCVCGCWACVCVGKTEFRLKMKNVNHEEINRWVRSTAWDVTSLPLNVWRWGSLMSRERRHS